MAKSEIKLKARGLRREGESIKKIAKTLNVSIGSVSSWCRDILLSPEQIKKLQMRVTDPYYGKKAAYMEMKRKEFTEKVLKLKSQGIKEIGKLTKREIFLIGVALYWGEGFKKDSQVGFANTNVGMLKFFILWLNECFSLDKKDLIIRVTANSAYKNRSQDLEKYWSKELGIPLRQFSKPFFQESIWKKKYENENDYHGVLRIKVRRSIDLLRRIYGFIDGIALNIN